MVLGRVSLTLEAFQLFFLLNHHGLVSFLCLQPWDSKKKKKKLQSGETFCTTWFTESQALLVLMKIKTSLQGKAFFSGTWLVGVDVSI